MHRAAFLNGTDHVYQFGAGTVFGTSKCTVENEAAFADFLRQSCVSNSVRAVCEELSTEALSEMGKSQSVPKSVADHLCLTHRYCDPIRSEQTALGICDENAIRAVGQMQGKLDGQIETEVLVERRKREPYWLAQLLEQDTWPVLFVCGAWHIPSFTALLRQHGLLAGIVANNWEA